VTWIRYIILRCTQLGIKEFVRMINQDYGSFLEPSQRRIVVIQSSLLVTVTPFAGTLCIPERNSRCVYRRAVGSGQHL
jgi:hypothetical protein